MLRNAARKRENRGENIDEYSVTRGERLPSLLCIVFVPEARVCMRICMCVCIISRYAFFTADLKLESEILFSEIKESSSSSSRLLLFLDHFARSFARHAYIVRYTINRERDIAGDRKWSYSALAQQLVLFSSEIARAFILNSRASLGCTSNSCPNT